MRLSLSSLLAVAALSLCSCSTPIPTPKGTSAGYHTARFVATAPRDRQAAPGALEDDPAFNSMVKDSIRRDFQSHGISVGGDQAQLIIAYMLVRQNSVATTMNSDYFGRGRDAVAILEEAHQRGVVKSTSPDESLKGAIVIDVLDARTNKLIYRNFAVRAIQPGATAATRQSRLDSAIAQALAPFFKS